MPDTSTDLQRQLAGLPKVDLHRHLEGSLRLETMLELVKREGLDLPQEEAALRTLVQVQPHGPHTSANFLAKFGYARKFFTSPEVIRRVTKEAIADAAAEKICYLELHFTPVALAEAGGFPLTEVVDWVIEAASIAKLEYALQLGLIASVNRQEAVGLAEKVTQIAIDQMDRGIVGLSLAGDEAGYPTEPFEPVFAAAQEAGLGITIHAGEWNGAEKVRHALEKMGARRIGHGVRVIEDPEVVAMARDRHAVFEVCLTSNVQSGVVPSISAHPLPQMVQAGLQVTLNTDDPGISDICLSTEYALAVEELGFSTVSLTGFILTAIQASFLPQPEKTALESDLIAALMPPI